MHYMKGQINFINLVGIFVTMMVYFLLLPILTQISDDTVATLNLNPNAQTGLTIVLIYLVEPVILIAIMLTTFNYAIPNREGVGRY